MPRRKVSLPLPRFINPASVEIDDVIRVTWQDRGIEHTRTARVHRRIDDGAARVLYTQEGAEIMHWLPGQDRKVRVTLLSTGEPVEPFESLFDDEMEAVIRATE